MTPFATFTFGDALLTVLEFALLFFWIWVAITVIFDIFRSRDLSGLGKAAWLFLVVIVPLFGVLIYLIVRGHNMHERAESAAAAQEQSFRTYVRDVANSPADEVTKLEELRSKGVITDEEFERAKQRALS
jgi:hypothetical protein